VIDMTRTTGRHRSRSLRRVFHVAAPLVLTLLATSVSAAMPSNAAESRAAVHRFPTDGVPLRYMRATALVMPAALVNAIRAVTSRPASIPSYSRQTRLACSACHYQFPALTPFGRLFKLNGYVLTGLTGITSGADTSVRQTLKLAPIPPASAMIVASLTNTRKAQPGTQNNDAAIPQQLSVFLAGEITPRLGAFTQVTYSSADASVSIDNIDIRFADHARLASKDLLLGLTLHNNPTVQDVWNTVPAWGFPFMASELAPSPIASPLIDGTLGQEVLGLGAYGLWNSLIYGEFTAYRSAPQGAASPLDSTAINAARGVIPYWRVALQHEFRTIYAMVGTYGFDAKVRPSGVAGPTNHFTDVAVDAQLERRVRTAGAVILRSTYIHERQRLDGLVAASPPAAERTSNRLGTFRINASVNPTTGYGLTAGYFSTTGRTDALLYPAAPVTGSRTGRPDTRGFIGELDFNPWQNTRLALQYVAYDKFNGASASYDAAGRSASANNTLYLYTWIAF